MLDYEESVAVVSQIANSSPLSEQNVATIVEEWRNEDGTRNPCLEGGEIARTIASYVLQDDLSSIEQTFETVEGLLSSLDIWGVSFIATCFLEALDTEIDTSCKRVRDGQERRRQCENALARIMGRETYARWQQLSTFNLNPPIGESR